MEIFNKKPWLLPTLIFTFLTISASLMHPLWGDEAETALFARNIIKFGYPKGWDGVNIMGINDGIVLNSELYNHTSPWAQYYLTAISFLFFGQTSFTARLPFILISIFSLPLIYKLIIKITSNKTLALTTLTILSLSPPFILFAFQDRYYAINTLCSLLLFYAVFTLHERKFWPKILFVISGILFFYSNYVVFAAFLASLLTCYFLNAILTKKNFSQTLKSLGLLALLCGIITVFTLPWYLIVQPFSDRGGTIIAPSLSPGYLVDFFNLYRAALGIYNQNNAFPLLFLVLLPFSIFILRRHKKPQIPSISIFTILPLLYLLTMTIFTAIAHVDTLFIHTRYTFNIFPFIAIASAIILTNFKSINKFAFLTLGTLYIFTNIFTLYPLRSFPLELAKEIFSPYSTPDLAVASYLKTHANDGDTAFVNIDRNHEPLIFHLKDKIRFVNRISLTNPRVFPKNRSILPRYIYDFRQEPDWIILYSKRALDGSFETFDMRPLPPGINLSNYFEVVIPVFFSDMSRPEVDMRMFSIPKTPYNDQVFILKRKS